MSTRSTLKRLTEEDRFSRRYATWTFNHNGWSKCKRTNRRIAKRKLKHLEKIEISKENTYGSDRT